jgi:fibronectin-binding autotransporter adhesin
VAKKTVKFIKNRARGFFLAAPPATAVFAADRTWTGSGGDTRWLNPQNWSESAAPSGNADVAIFPAGTPSAVLLDQSIVIKTVYFRNPGMTLTIAAGANLHFDNLGALTIRADEDATVDGDGTLTFSVNTGENFADNQAATGKTLAILAKITGANGFEHNGGGGTIVLANAANDQSGNTLITSTGVLSVPSVANAGVASPLGTGSAFRFTTLSTTFRYTGTGGSTDRSFYQNAAASQDVSVEHAGSGTLTFTGPFLSGNDNSHAFIFNVIDPDAVIDLAGTVQNGGTAALWLTKRGAGTVLLSGAHTYTGNTLVEGGTLAVTPSGSLSAASLIRVRGGTLLLNAGSPAATYTAAFGALQVDGNASTVAVAPGAASAQITFASIANLSGTVDFTAEGLGTTTKIFISGQPNGLIGPWATVNGGADLAAYDAVNGVHAADFPSQNLTALGPSVIASDAGSAARITAAGTSGGIALAAAPTAIAARA